LFRWALYDSTRGFCPALAALDSQVQTIVFHTEHYFDLFVPIAKHAWQTVVLGRTVSEYVSLVTNDKPLYLRTLEIPHRIKVFFKYADNSIYNALASA
jgi:hypothetical protein